MAHPGGRPVEYTPERIQEIIEAMENYIEWCRQTIPSIAGFAYENKIPRQALYDHSEFSDVIKRLRDKREMMLEERLFSDPRFATGTIFALKQMGWSDKQEIDHTTKGQSIIPVVFADEKLKDA